MTRAACNLIIKIAKASLMWRSIKSLKRSGKERSHPNIHHKHDYKYYEEIDLEILQLWSIMAFLTIYERCGLESILSLVPLYHYFKMILVIITVIPATKFPNFWCELFLVPWMQRCHELLDVNVDLKSLLWTEFMMLPWRILDLTIMPGLLCDENDMKEMKHKRFMEICDANDKARRYKQMQMQMDTMQLSSENQNQNGTENKTENYEHCENSQNDPNDLKSVEVQTNSPIDINKHNNNDNNTSTSKSTKTTSQLWSSPNNKTRKVTTSSPRNKHNTNKNTTRSPKTTTAAASKLQSSKRHSSRTSHSRVTARTSSSITRSKNANSNSNAKTTTRTSRRTRTSTAPPPLSAFQRTRLNRTTGNTTNRKKNQLTDDTTNHDSDETYTIEEEEQDENEEITTTISTPKSTLSSSSSPGAKETLSHRLRNFITGDSNLRIRDYLFDMDLLSVPSRESNIGFSTDHDSHGIENEHDEPHQQQEEEEEEEEEEENDVSSKRTQRGNEQYRRRQQRQPGQSSNTTRRQVNTKTASISSLPSLSREERINNRSNKKNVSVNTKNVGCIGSARSNSSNSVSKNKKHPNKSKKEGKSNDDIHNETNVTIRRSRRLASSRSNGNN